MKSMKSILLIAFLWSSCAPAATAIPTFTPQPTETLTPSPTATEAPTPTITPTATPMGGGSGKLIFEYYRAGFEKSFPDLEGEVNIFISNIDGTDLTPVTNGLKGSNHIEAISSDGGKLLISSSSGYPANGDLLLIDLTSPGSDPIRVAGGIAPSRWPQAIFLNNARIAYVGQEHYGMLYTVNMDGTDRKNLGNLAAEFAGIVSSDQSRIYYEGYKQERFKDSSGVLYTYGDTVSLWWTNIDGSGQGKLASKGHQIFPIQVFPTGIGEIGEGVAFSPDGTSIAWIPKDLEPDCSYLASSFWTPAIRDGTYTKNVEKVSPVLNKNSPHFGKVIDAAYVEDYVRSCFILHVAPLSNMDSDIEIPLMPPFDPAKDDFLYHKDYALRWWPDSSKILAYEDGYVTWYGAGQFQMILYELSPNSINPSLALLKILSDTSVVQPQPGGQFHFIDSYGSFKFSPDSRQILFTKYNYGNQGSMIKALDLGAMNYIDNFSHNITLDFQIKRVGNIYWLP